MSDEDAEYDSGVYEIDEPMEQVTAIILAGGKGTRMKPHTGPKCLVPLKSKPFIYHLFDQLKEAGITKIRVCVGYKAAEVMAAVGQYPGGQGLEIKCSDSGEDATMGERLSEAAKKLDTPTALICYGDTLADVALKDALMQHKDDDAAMTLVGCHLTVPFGVLRLHDTKEGTVAAVDEKPTLPVSFFIGYTFAESWAFLRLKPEDDMVTWLNRIAKADHVGWVRHQGFHLTINTEHDREDAERILSGR